MTVSSYLWNTVLEVETGWSYGNRTIVSELVVLFSHDCVNDGRCSCQGCPVSLKSPPQHIASPGKDHNSKSEEQFLLKEYQFLMIVKLKNPKSNPCRWGAIYTKHNTPHVSWPLKIKIILPFPVYTISLSHEKFILINFI